MVSSLKSSIPHRRAICMLKLSTSVMLNCKPCFSNIYLKHASHILPVAGLGVGDAALFVVGVVVHGVTLAIKNQIKNEINREIL